MDSRVVHSQVHENDEHQPHNVDSQQDEHHSDPEKKSVMNRVMAKAKKITDTIKKHGHHVPDDPDLDEDKEMVEDPEVHEAPINDSEAVKIATPTSEQDGNLGKSEFNSGGTTVTGEEPHHDPLVVGVSSTNEINQNIATDPAKTFVGEENQEQCKVNLERPIGLEEDPHSQGSRPEAYSLPNYQTKVTDPSGTGSDEIEDITPVEKSFERMNVQDEPKPTPEPKVLSTVADTEYPSAGSHDQFVPHLSADTKDKYPSAGTESHDQFAPEMKSSNINRNLEVPSATGQTFNNITTTVEEQPHHEPAEMSNKSSHTDEISSVTADEIVSPGNAEEASKLGYDEKGDRNHEEQQKSGDASNKSGSTAESGKNIAQSLTDRLAPVYEKVAGVGSAVKSKVYGTGTGGVGTETKNGVKDKDKGVSVKDYLAEKLRPGEEDKALSEVISETLPKRKEEPMKKEHGDLVSGEEKSEKEGEESNVNSPGKGMVDKVKGVVGSWFAKSSENQSPQVAGGEDLTQNKNSGAEVEQVSQVGDERRTQE